MTRVFITLILLLILAGCQKDELPNATTQTTPGGMTYAFIQMDDQKDVSVQIAWPTDWAWRDGVNQTVPYVGSELILAGGAKGYPAGEVVELFADLKARAFLFPTADHIYGQLDFEKANMDEPVKVANAHLVAPTLDENWFTRTRDGWKKRIAEETAKPETMGYSALRWAMFGDQPLRVSLSLDAPGIFESVTSKEIADWHKETFTRKLDAVVVAGEISVNEANSIIDGLFAGLPEGGREMKRDAKANFAPKRILLHVPTATTTNLSFTGPIPPTRLGKEFEDVFLVSALGGDDQSALFTDVRTGLRATYGYSAGLGAFTRDNRFLVMTGAIETSKLAEAEQIVSEAYSKFLETGPAGDVSPRKSTFLGGLDDTIKHCDSLATTALQTLVDGSPIDRALKLKTEVEAITSATLKERLSTAFPKPDQFVIVAVSPDSNALPGACVITRPEDAVNCK